MSAHKPEPHRTFTLGEPSIEEVANMLAGIYAGVSLSRDPIFSWLEIMNDVTILGEDLRRERNDEAVDRAATVLARLLEFIGYFTYVHKLPQSLETSSDFVAWSLQERSYTQYIPEKLQEGPTRWILAKYPRACSKCGMEQCQCLLAPWVLENRREEPSEYFERFRSKAEAQRAQLLEDHSLKEFTLQSLIEHFNNIYRANFYHQDAWKLGMHLSEEMGEATVELRRIELRRLAQQQSFDIKSQASEIIDITKASVAKNMRKIKKKKERDELQKLVDERVSKFETELQQRPWEFFGGIVAEKFKEEIADVLSWLVAIIIKLNRPDTFAKFPGHFEREGKGGVVQLVCPWCKQPKCTNQCLIAHGVSKEFTEQILKF
jgi:hypothetical protein